MGKVTGAGSGRILMEVGMAMLLSCSVALAEQAVPGNHASMESGSAMQGFMHGVAERFRASPDEITWKETADAVLIQHSELEWNRYVKRAMNLPDWVDVGIENRTRFEIYDHPWRTSQKIGGGRPDPQVALRSRVRLGLDGGPFRFLFEGQDARAYLNTDPGDFVDDTTVDEWDILQLFGSMTLDNVLGTGLRADLHFGRFTLDFGKRRLIARNDFRNNSNTFDGVHWHIGQDRTWRVRAFFVEPVIRNDVKLDKGNENSLFWGIHAESEHLPLLNANVYYYGLNDQRNTNAATHRTFSTFGVRLYTNPKESAMDYELESTWQTGTFGDIDHFAHLQHLDVGYTFNLPWSPRVLIHYDYASGDRKPGDNQDGRFDTLFGARRFELMPTGTFGPFFRTNFSSPGWRVIVTPANGWTIQLKHRVWYLAQGKDTFGSSGLRDASGGSGNFLGHDVECRVQWAVSQNLDFDVGYDHWFKGSYFDRLPATADLPAGGNKDTDYFYLSMKVRL